MVPYEIGSVILTQPGLANTSGLCAAMLKVIETPFPRSL